MVQATAIPNSENGGNGTGGNGGSSSSLSDMGNPHAPGQLNKEYSQDQPVRVIVKTYYDRYQTSVDTGFYNLSDFNWVHNVGGSKTTSHRVPDLAECGDTETTWPADEYPPTKTGTMVDYPLGEPPSTSTVDPPALFMESCNVKTDILNLDSLTYEHYSRQAKTKVSLFTGGKALRKRRNLFSISAPTIEIKDHRYHPTATYGPPWEFVPPTQVQIGDLGTLGSDGFLYKVLPDNEYVDVTPKTKRQFYMFNVEAVKHKLFIQASPTADGSVIILSDTRTRSQAHFSVGQKVNLGPVLSPPISGSYFCAASWLLPDNYVNEVNFDCIPPKYGINQAWLIQPNTHAWWINGGSKLIAFSGDINFQNGQQVIMMAFGRIETHKPQIMSHTHPQPVGVFLDNVVLNDFGLDIAFGGQGMNAILSVQSKYAGKGNTYQLICRDLEVDAIPYLQKTYNSYYLDNTFPYEYNTDDDIAANQLSAIMHSDSPGNGWQNYINLNDKFRTFFMFRPSVGEESSNIWVVMARMTWGFNAAGLDDSGPAFCTSCVEDPVDFQLSDSFELWYNILYNGIPCN